MKKSVLKILALIMALTLVASFAACGKKDEPANATETTTDLFADAGENEEQPTEAVSADESTAAVDESTTVAASEDASLTAADESSAATTEASKGLNSTNVAEVLSYYNAAFKATRKGAPKGQSTMKLDGGITGDGAIGGLLKVLSPAAEKALAKNSTPTDYIPGQGNLTAADISKAQATSKNGVTTVTIQLKPQTDGSNADPKAGPVGRGIGTLGSIDGALNELGAEITSGKDTVKLTYNNAYIKCTINENSGRITGGTWHYTVNVNVGSAKAKISILSATLSNLKAKVDYQVAI